MPLEIGTSASSTDLHTLNVNELVFDKPTAQSTFLHFSLLFEQVPETSTILLAKQLLREHEEISS